MQRFVVLISLHATLELALVHSVSAECEGHIQRETAREAKVSNEVEQIAETDI